MISRKEHCVLEQLAAGDKFGLELVAGSRGVLARRTLYVLLARMEDRYLIEGREEDGATLRLSLGAPLLPRRRYSITDHGRRVLARNVRLPSRRWGPFREEFYSICSAHQRNDASCDLCTKGMWINVHRHRIGSLVFKRWPKVWRWWANR